MVTFQTTRKILQIFCFYLIPILASSFIFFQELTGKDSFTTAILYGTIAMYLLISTLFLKPLSIFFPKILLFKQLLPLRKEFGVLIFWFALLHTIILSYHVGVLPIEALLFSPNPLTDFLFWGSLGFVIIVALGITSNKIAAKKLGRRWKQLHYLAYPALGFVALHQYFNSGTLIFIAIFLLFVVVRISAYVVQKKRLARAQQQAQEKIRAQEPAQAVQGE